MIARFGSLCGYLVAESLAGFSAVAIAAILLAPYVADPVPPVAGRQDDAATPPAGPFPPLTLPAGQLADHVVIEKAARRLTLWRSGEKIGTYRIALGFAPKGDKRREGDGKTPEGRYRVDRRNPRSSYHLSLGIDYPRPDQRRQARARGRDPGGDIFIHGQPHRRRSTAALPYDWTAGCAAVSNLEIEEIWRHVAIGTTVEIRP